MRFSLKSIFNLKILLLTVGFSSYAQQVKISGKVKDTLQTTLAYANILAIPQNDNEAVKFAITEEKWKLQTWAFQKCMLILIIEKRLGSIFRYMPINYSLMHHLKEIKNFDYGFPVVFNTGVMLQGVKNTQPLPTAGYT